MKRSWLLATLLWVIVAVVYTAQMIYLSRQPGERIVLQTVVIASAAYYLCWIPLTPPVWWMSKSWTPDLMRPIALFWRHLALGLAISAIHAVLSTAVTGWLLDRFLTGVMLMSQIRARIASGLLMYAVIAGAGMALSYYARWRERELAAVQLEAELSDARLQSLRAQLHPHFLFNTLNAISALVRSGDNAGAVRAIAGLSDLLRGVLDAGARETVPLAEEAAFIERYFEIQRLRFGDRLTTSVQIEPDAATVPVPSLLLQPLVENALRHGLADRVEPGHVTVRASRSNGALHIVIEDDGAGLPAGWETAEHRGVGLRNTRARLDQQYGGDYDFTIAPREGGGAAVTIRVPA